MAIGDKLMKMRKKSGLSRKELADKVGVTQSAFLEFVRERQNLMGVGN